MHFFCSFCIWAAQAFIKSPSSLTEHAEGGDAFFVSCVVFVLKQMMDTFPVLVSDCY